MNILIKLTCLIGLVIAPILGGHTKEGVTEVEDKAIEIVVNDDVKITEANTKTINYTEVK